MSRSSRLVNDLIPIILELNEEHWWPSDYYQFALISNAWLGPTRRYLYRCPAIRTSRSYALLARTLIEYPHLGSLVGGIDLRPSRTTTHSHCSFSEDEASGLRYILGLRGLRSLTLGGHLSIRAERFLYMLQHSQDISYLHIDGSDCIHNPSPSLEWDEIIATKLPRLRELRLSKLRLTIIPPTIPLYPFRIQAIYLQNIELVDGILPDICQESWKTVHTLAIIAKSAENPDVEQILWTLESCRSLECFEYEIQESGIQEHIFDGEAISYPSLRSLRLSDTPLNFRTLSAIGTLCSNLQELSVHGRAARVTSEEWTLFLRSGALPLLQKLSICAGTNHPPFSFWDAGAKRGVFAACADRQIICT